MSKQVRFLDGRWEEKQGGGKCWNIFEVLWVVCLLFQTQPVEAV